MTMRGAASNFSGGNGSSTTALVIPFNPTETPTNFSIEERQIVLSIVQESRNRIKNYGNLVGAAYGAALDEVYQSIRTDLGFSQKIAFLEDRYGYANMKSLVYGIKKCKPENIDKCFQRHYRSMVQMLDKKTALIYTTSNSIEEAIDGVPPYGSMRVTSLPASNSYYYTEGGSRNAGGGAYAVVDGEIKNPEDVRHSHNTSEDDE